MKLFGKDKLAILQQVSKEYQYGYNTIESKREQRRDDLALYMKEADKNKVDIHSIYTSVQTLLGIFYANEVVVTWKGRNRFDRERAVNTNKCLRYDYKEMDIEVKDYELEFNRFMFGVGVQMSDGFDRKSIVPKIKNISPLACVPDPEGGPTIKTHRFFGIETSMTKAQMKAMGYEDYDLIGQQTTQEQNRDIKEIKGYSNTLDDIDNKMYDVYVHFMRDEKGELFVAVTGNSNSVLLGFDKLEAVTEEEKQDPYKIYIPIGLKYYSYQPGDFFSVSVPDLLRDKQSVYSTLFNAMLSSALRNALGDDRLVNPKKVKDLAGLRTPTMNGKIIPVNIGDNENISNVIYQIPKDNIGNLPMNVKQYLEELSNIDVGIDRNTSGVLSTQNATLGEREMAQRNANIRFLLATKQGMWFEEFRWKFLWYRMYQANLKSIDKKTVYFDTSYSSTSYSFKKDDFIGEEDLYLELVSKAAKEQELSAKKADRLALLPQLIAGAKSEDEKVMLYRELLEATGEDEEYIMALFPLTANEMRAYDKLAMIDEDDIRGAEIDDILDPHEVFIRIFQTAEDNNTKRIALNRRYEAIKMRSQYETASQEPINGAEQSAQNVSSAQLTNASIQNAKQVPSLADVAQ